MRLIQYVPEDWAEVKGYHRLFNVLSNYLQPTCQASLETGLRQCINQLAYRPSQGLKTEAFFVAAIHISAQTSYTGPLHQKLAMLILAMLHARDLQAVKIAPIDGWDAADPNTAPMAWFSSVHRHCITAKWEGYVNQEAVLSMVASGIWASGYDYTTNVRCLKRAFERKTHEEAEVMAAALWILNYGHLIYQSARTIRHDEDDDSECARSCRAPDSMLAVQSLVPWTTALPGRIARPSQGRWTSICFDRWRFWRQSFMDIYLGEQSKRLPQGYSHKCRALALKAVQKMLDLEDEDSS